MTRLTYVSKSYTICEVAHNFVKTQVYHKDIKKSNIEFIFHDKKDNSMSNCYEQ